SAIAILLLDSLVSVMLPLSLVLILCFLVFLSFFFFNGTATTEIYTLSLHDALPISKSMPCVSRTDRFSRIHARNRLRSRGFGRTDRKSTRLNSCHLVISYAVFCLKKKKSRQTPDPAKKQSPPYRHLG